MTLTLRYMRLADIPQVLTIDHLSFDVSWSAQAYHFEIHESNYSHMIVLEDVKPTPRPVSTLERLFRSLGNGNADHREIIGYGGLWHIANEAHVSTIAVHPKHRGKGFGELLLAAMITRSARLHAAYVVLEVRVSNGVAQNLYRKYGFETKMIKERYYQSNGEDAYEMRLNLAADSLEAIHNHFNVLIEKYELADDYTQHPQAVRRR